VVTVVATAADIRALAETVLDDVGLQLWDVDVTADVVKILVERDGGVDLDALTVANEVLSGLLDAHDELVPSNAYQLVVSSPGLERSLRTPEQYRRYLGTTVAVKTSAAIDGVRRHRGVLRAVSAEGIELVAETTPKGRPLSLGFDQIDRTLTVVDWAEALKAPSRPATAPTRSDVAGARDAASRTPGPAQDSKDHPR
jgi:ribosome maturation factor RimP